MINPYSDPERDKLRKEKQDEAVRARKEHSNERLFKAIQILTRESGNIFTVIVDGDVSDAESVEGRRGQTRVEIKTCSAPTFVALVEAGFILHQRELCLTLYWSFVY